MYITIAGCSRPSGNGNALWLPEGAPSVDAEVIVDSTLDIRNDGFMIKDGPEGRRIMARTEVGALYGTYALQRLERTGAFSFSPEEGTPAADMEFVDSQTAQDRAEMVETIQSRIMDDYNTGLMGKTMEVLVDGYDEETEQFFGRTYADSPEIDGRVWIASEEALSEGTFVWVHIDGMIDGDLSGYIVEEEQ